MDKRDKRREALEVPSSDAIGRRFFDLSFDLVCVCHHGIVASVNPVCARMLGAGSPKKIIGRDFSEFIHRDFACIDNFLEMLAEEGENLETKLVAIDGSVVDAEIRVIGVPELGDGWLMVIASDITERLRFAHANLNNEMRFRKQINNALDLVLVCEGLDITSVNAAGVRLLRARSAEDVVGRKLTELLHPDYRDLMSQELESLLADTAILPMKIVCMDGSTRDLEFAFISIGPANSSEFMVYTRDITEHNSAVVALRESNENLEERIGQRTVELTREIAIRKQAEETASRQAQYDSLTDLPNRSLFLNLLRKELKSADRKGSTVGLMFIDLDGFKDVNDTLGHAAGDLLLQTAAERLISCGRPGDTVARLGGDEFTMILPNLQKSEDATSIAQRILDALSRPFVLDESEAVVSGSIGVAFFPDDATQADELISRADAAMYRAKDQGKANAQFFTAALNKQAKDRRALSRRLFEAVEGNEFTLFYLPRIVLSTGTVTGVEGLLRWNNATLGSVVPAQFIPLLEETGLITQVGAWSVQTACGQYHGWIKQGHAALKIALNVSARQLRTPGFVESVISILEEWHLPPDALELEIQEAMVLSDTDRIIAVLERLHGHGIGLTMDDFGTGYASLSVLKRLPIDHVKIDRSFISRITTSPDDRQTVKSIISLVHDLGRVVVAEGVETTAQLKILRDLGCDEVQGFLFSQPIPAVEVADFIDGQSGPAIPVR
jgi:diguanylate cyclase (GGDEF)-like protein